MTIDTDGDGVEDTLAHEPGDDVRCVDHTCHIVSPPGAPCLDDDACAAEQRCVRGAGWDPLRAGRCETTHCELCLAGEICAEGSGARGLCSAWCVIGADEPDAIVGIDGHGAGCAPGFRCEEPSSTTPSDGGREGVCRPGTYTDVPTPNLGAACASDDECHSPYGRGMCLRRRDDGPGRCSLVQCIEDAAGIVGFLPDVPVDPARWCDPAAGFSCREGRCVQECVRAEDCPAGLACALWPRASHRICAPECLNEYDCRSTEECNAPDGTRCSVGDRTCTCAPR